MSVHDSDSSVIKDPADRLEKTVQGTSLFRALRLDVVTVMVSAGKVIGSSTFESQSNTRSANAHRPYPVGERVQLGNSAGNEQGRVKVVPARLFPA